MEVPEDPVPKTIMDMPVHLMQKITEDLSPFEKTVQILSTIKAGHLDSLSLEFEEPMGREHFTRVFEIDQFKQAQIVEIHCIVEFNLEDLVHFEHLKQLFCGVRSLVEPEEILQIRDTVSTFNYSNPGPLEVLTHRYQNPAFNGILEFTIRQSVDYTLMYIFKVR
ncbi:unnamed protein product [Caenorhabditis nigoni]